MTPKIHRLVLVFIAIALFHTLVRGADVGTGYLEPKTLKATIYADASLKKVLFTFHRSATNSGSSVYVVREYNLPDGTAVGRERVVYDGNKMRSFAFDDLQTGAKGSADVKKTGGEERMDFKYTEGSTKKSGNEKVVPDILVSDMIGPFIVAHWKELAGGASVKFRLIATTRAETVGFKLYKESETTWHGKPAINIRMQPSSIIIARLVDPLHFIVEKDGEHRVFEYIGRTTPRIQKNGKWEDLDAVTVFDWNSGN